MQKNGGNAQRSSQLITAQELADILRIGQRTCWRLATQAEAGEGSFPKPLRIGPRMARWRLSDVEAYITSVAGGKTRKTPELT